MEVTVDNRPVKTEYKSFRIITTPLIDGSEHKQIEVHGDSLIEFLRNHTNLDESYADKPVIDMHKLSALLDQIKIRANRYNTGSVSKELQKVLEEENKGLIIKANNLMEKGLMSFGLLKALFTEGTEIEIVSDEISGGTVISSEYKSSMFSGTYLRIRYEYITSNGNNFQKSIGDANIYSWAGTKSIDKLSVRKMTDSVKAALIARGEAYKKIAIGNSYMHYIGQMHIKKWWSWTPMRSDGRIMVDIATNTQFNGDDDYNDRESDDIESKSLDDTMLWMTDPYVFGFSFSTKQWGRFAVSKVSDIQFKDHAFDQLVLADDKKDLIRALVTNNSEESFSDIISGKGGGCIFLLHGEPGVGKTLTAEAIAELLHRPLYSVSVGELGVNTNDLETNLRKILDVAQIWNAVILIDEADIFLEKRTSGDILRNAMVGIFLRLLEYHQGVLFLTTNRVTEFDSAFHSRISIALKYGKLSQKARQTIWENLLSAANVVGLDAEKLSVIDINGRQIKTTIRLAQGLARQQGTHVSLSHINATLAVSQQFQQDLLG